MNDLSLQMKLLERRVISSLPQAQTKLTFFPSGSVWLDVRFDGRLLYLRSHANGWFGVDELLPEDGGMEQGDRFNFDSFAGAADQLIRLVTGVESVAKRERRAV